MKRAARLGGGPRRRPPTWEYCSRAGLHSQGKNHSKWLINSWLRQRPCAIFPLRGRSRMTSRVIGARRPRHLLSRLLDTPNLAQVVPSLDATVLTALVRHCGLEDCGEIVGLATAEQLVRVFDDDLWRGDEAGREDEFDAERFGLWLEVLADSGVTAAAQKIVEMGLDFATAALSRHVLALDQDTLLLGETLTAALDG